MRKKAARLVTTIIATFGFFGATAMASTIESGDKEVDKLLSDIALKKRDSAISRISSIESLAGDRSLAQTPAEFVDKLSGCSVLKTETRTIGASNPIKFIEVSWKCAGQSYVSVFDPDYAKPYITVADFETAEARERRRARPTVSMPVVPAPIPVKSAEDIEKEKAQTKAILNRFGAAVTNGQFKTDETLFAGVGRVTFGRRNAAKSITLIELDGDGPSAAIEQTAAAWQKLGKPSGFECNVDEFVNSCKFSFVPGDRMLLAFVRQQQGLISGIDYMYATRETALQDMNSAQ